MCVIYDIKIHLIYSLHNFSIDIVAAIRYSMGSTCNISIKEKCCLLSAVISHLSAVTFNIKNNQWHFVTENEVSLNLKGRVSTTE